MAESVVVHVEPGSVEITPGGSAVALTVRVINATSIVDSFTVGVEGGEDWLVAPPVEVRLLPGAQTTVNLKLTIPADRFVAAGPRTLEVRAVSAAETKVQQTVSLPAVVRGVAGNIAMRLDPQIITAARDASFLVRLRNPGNAPVVLKMSAEDAKGGSTFTFDPQEVTVPPRYEVAVTASVSTPRPRTGQDESRAFTVHADGGNLALTANGNLTVKPLFGPAVMRALKIVLGILGMLAIGAVAMIFIGPSQSVPKVVGKTRAEAEAMLVEKKFKVSVTEQTSAQVAAGLVIDQTPAAGQSAKEGSTVDLTVSLGAEQVKVPKLVGLTEAQAMVALQSAGLSGMPGGQEFSAEAAGTVVKQMPEEGATVAKGSAVTYVVSKGTETKKLPDTSTMTGAKAKKALEALGYVVVIEERVDGTKAPGTILEQKPPAGGDLAVGETITLVVVAAQDVTMPNVVGYRMYVGWWMEANAKSMLSAAPYWMKVTVKYQTGDPTTNGRVAKQEPLTGTAVKSGSTATIWVYKAP